MTADSMFAVALGMSTAWLLAWAFNRRTPKASAPVLPLTVATNSALLNSAQLTRSDDPDGASTAQSQRLKQLVESGALTQQEYEILTSSQISSGSDTARLSILVNGPNKIQDIKMLREVFRLGLREAKDIVDHLPQTFVAPIPYAKAETIAHQLQSAGMTIHIT